MYVHIKFNFFSAVSPKKFQVYRVESAASNESNISWLQIMQGTV